MCRIRSPDPTHERGWWFGGVAVKKLMCLGLALIGQFSFAATIRFDGESRIVLEGEIVTGDSARLEAFVTEKPEKFLLTKFISLNSRGGDVSEALKMAQFIEAARFAASVESENSCASACFLLLAGASVRLPMGTVAVHRPFLHKAAYEDASILFVTATQREATRAVTAFLRDRSVPERLLEHMTATPSERAYILTAEDKDLLGTFSPAWEEVLIAKCAFSNSDLSDESDLAERLKCAFDTATAARYELLARYVSPEVAREAIRTVLIGAGAIEPTNGALAPSGLFPDVAREPATPVNDSVLSSAPSTTPHSPAPARRGGKMAEVLWVEFLHYEPTKTIATRADDMLTQVWVEFSRSAVAKDIRFVDPTENGKRVALLVNELLPNLARRGDARAAFALATLYLNMEALDSAFDYFKLAAKLGMHEGLLMAGAFCERGNGTLIDKPRALAYYSLAEIRGVTKAQGMRRALESKLSPEEVTQAASLRAMIESTLPAR